MADARDTIKLVVDMGPSASNVKEVTKEVDALGHAATAAAGKPGAGGQGIQGVSYAVQDFASVLTGGGGIARALGAVTNNFDQLARAAGASVATAAKLSLAFTGFTAALPLLIPVIEQFWKALAGGEAGKGPEPVVKALDAAEERIKRIRAELEKIKGMIPPEEAETRQLVEEFLGFTGGTEKLGPMLAKAMEAAGLGAGMTEAQRRRVEERRIYPGMTDEEWAAERQRQQIAAAEVRREMHKATEAMATELLGGAPLQAAARRRIGQIAAAAPRHLPPGFAGQLAELEPEVQAARQAKEEDERIDAEARKERREARVKAAKERAAESEKALAEMRPGEGEAAEMMRLRAAAVERAPHEAARKAREEEGRQLEARERAAAAEIRRTEGVRMEPKEALQEVERRRRQAVQDQLDRNRELRAAEQGRQETGRPYNPDASIEALRQHNRDLRAAMERFTEATNDASGTSFAMARILNARAGVLEGQSQMNGPPAYNFGKP